MHLLNKVFGSNLARNLKGEFGLPCVNAGVEAILTITYGGELLYL